MEKNFIDINCDVGEGIGNEEKLFPFISSCNIACGGHAGDEDIMKKIVVLANKYQVKVGAHPSYPDKENFGRVSLTLSPSLLKATILEQVAKLIPILEEEGMILHHIKAHGALYNDVAKDKALATVFLDAVEQYKTGTFIYVPFGSILEIEAKRRGFKIKLEAFGDRNYNLDFTLVSRNKPNAVIHDPKSVLWHIIGMVKNNSVKTMEGEDLKINAETYCIHGDTPTALQILAYLSEELPNNQIYIKK
ncbi:5-oxoprolinase subunit PxpA [Flavobacteriaceae bacterium KMM 6897]|nr:5-oxoprolinase subunit PxpA [Flavobacteriaceae bacterium KMM 6897]